MVLVPVTCPYCRSVEVGRYGKRNGKQLYICNNKECSHTTFPEKYTYKACDPKVKKQIFETTVNGNGTRATARILGISKDTVTAALKKKKKTYGT